MTGRVSMAAAGVVGLLLTIAAAAALARTAAGTGYVRTAGAATAALLIGCAYGVIRRRDWALGCAFFLGLLWFVSTVALGLQRRLPPGPTAAWLAWALLVIAASVKARTDARPDIHAQG